MQLACYWIEHGAKKSTTKPINWREEKAAEKKNENASKQANRGKLREWKEEEIRREVGKVTVGATQSSKKNFLFNYTAQILFCGNVIVIVSCFQRNIFLSA